MVPLELRLRPHDPFSHPVLGEIIPTSNLLLKVTRKRRKCGSGPNGEYMPEDYKMETEIVGIIVKTGRFRALADYQYVVEPSDPMVKLKQSLNNFNIEGISNFEFATDKGVQENLRNIPPPIFSRIEWSLSYRYQQFANSTLGDPVPVEAVAESGKVVKRSSTPLRNPCLKLTRESLRVPTGPTPQILAFLDTMPATPEVFARIESLFAARPVYTFVAVSNLCRLVLKRRQDVKLVSYLLPRYAYFMTYGPWRECWVRYGYDPRVERDARIYQHVCMRFVKAPQPLGRAKRLIGVGSRARLLGAVTKSAINAVEEEDADHDKTHIFDGTLWKGTAKLQLCDITDPDVVRIIQSNRGVRKIFDNKDGWYENAIIDSVRKIVRNKIMQQTGRSVDDADIPDYNSDDEGAASPTGDQDDEDDEDESDDDSARDQEGAVRMGEGGGADDRVGRPHVSESVSSKIDALMRTLQSSQLAGAGSTSGPSSAAAPNALIDDNEEDEFDYFDEDD
ncbi:RNA polymerase III transcription factor IIIC subunit-domain-containing protein [Chytriomyces sp. MP71]|nr:RNA polymerase III transcription factor IIIC subunit-domain-containing protein [Chytriomyces sp. MP71]